MAAIGRAAPRLVHHQLAEDTHGNALVIDEWPHAASFHQFADQQDIAKVMAGVTDQPTVTIYRILTTPDRF